MILLGKLCVIVFCYLIKNVQVDVLLFCGGGVFIVEMDGNLILLKVGEVICLYWQGKYWGLDFKFIYF